MSKRVMPDNKALVQNKKPKSDDLISGETPPHQQHRFNDDLVKELTKSLQPHIPALNSKLHNLAQAVAPALAKANVF